MNTKREKIIKHMGHSFMVKCVYFTRLHIDVSIEIETTIKRIVREN